jgi:hypothetical protein
MNYKHILAIFTLLFPFMGQSNEPHITESFPCKALMEDYAAIPSYDQRNFIEKVDTGVNVAIEKYSALKDVNRLEQAKKLKSCIHFLKTFPNYVESLKKAQPVLDTINPSEAPDFMAPDKKEKPAVSKLTKEQAWQLLECKPCQEVRKLCQNDQGSFSNEKAKKLQENVHWLSNGSLVTTKEEWRQYTNWHGKLMIDKIVISTPKLQDELIPKAIHDKALLVEKCLEVIKEKQYFDNRAQHIENYFKDIKDENNEQ